MVRKRSLSESPDGRPDKKQRVNSPNRRSTPTPTDAGTSTATRAGTPSNLGNELLDLDSLSQSNLFEFDASGQQSGLTPPAGGPSLDSGLGQWRESQNLSMLSADSSSDPLYSSNTSWPTQDITHLDLSSVTPTQSIPSNIPWSSLLLSPDQQGTAAVPGFSTSTPTGDPNLGTFDPSIFFAPLQPNIAQIHDTSMVSTSDQMEQSVSDQLLSLLSSSDLFSQSSEMDTNANMAAAFQDIQPTNIQGIDSFDVYYLQSMSPNRYEVITPLNSGAYGCIYTGRRLPDNRDCAIKVLKSGVMGSSSLTNAVELNIVKLLIQSPNNNVLQFYDAVESLYDRTYITSELSTIGDLFTFMLRKNPQNQLIWQPMNELNAKYLIRGIANGMRHLHTLDIAHGDLKPENILLFYSSDVQSMSNAIEVTKLVPKLCDFSNSRMRNFLTDPEGQVMHSARTCTINYSAPESGIDNCPPFDMISADVYSLGCNLLALLLGTAPFQPAMAYVINAYEVASNQLKTNPRYIQSVLNAYDCSTNLKDILRRSLAITPGARITLHKFLMHHWFLSLEHKKN